MVLRNKFLRKKEIIIKTWTLHKRKVHIKKKGRAYEFYNKGKIDVMNFWEQKNLFQLNTLVQRWSFHRIYEIKNIVFLSQKVDGNMIFTDYWKVLVLTFSEMGNTVFSWAKKLTEIWYLLITGKFLFWTFQWWEIRFFLSQEVDGKMIFTGYWEVLVLNVSVMENTAFFQPKSWWKDGIYVVFLSFLWYSRTWEIWLFAQCYKGP